MALTTATQIAYELNISSSYLFALLEKGVFVLKNNKWDTAIIDDIKKYMANNSGNSAKESLVKYKTTKINNRRYLGNKYKLLPFIKRIVDENCIGINTVADIFAGTGAVASAFTDKKIITNDNMYSNYICHVAWFGSEEFSQAKIVQYIQQYNSMNIDESNYMTDNFADTYFSRSDCSKIGYIREDIEKEYVAHKINERERALLITSLLYAMDKIANTCGHYDAYRQGVVFDKHLELSVPIPEKHNNSNNICYNEDANDLVKYIQADLVYIDPPYNSRQYCDAYHLIENVARWEKPKVTGVARKMDRNALKSDYCTQNATKAFEELIENISAKYILLSYNNMAEKGNQRSNAKISDEDIFRILEKKGPVTVYSEAYKAFTTGKSNIDDNQERLFLCECYDKKEIIPSPLNYIGGKFKLLPQILPLFPKISGTFVDLFCGGCNVGINVDCSKAVLNDKNRDLCYMYNAFKNLDKSELFRFINVIIDKYGLSRSSEKGYDFYGCDSSKGLGSYNKEPFLKMRKDFNEHTNLDYYYYSMLYVLVIYSFNNQIRFNRDGKFNLPVGKRDFNDKMQEKLSKFVDRLKSGDYTFTYVDFRDIDLDKYGADDFIYADPPYFITCATYNEQGGWSEEDERDLYSFLDNANSKGIRFALSNVVSSEGKTNKILTEWVEKNKYKVIHLDYNYSNSNYQKKDRESGSDEVLIVNY
ncbi:MAG: Dam family site-specific DNA-(adenine-N6)-methyltransferase [Eubacterium sp.]|nr:Dam family site-specific DNA-(adenine-N6)-methyltransferase [Eubacterium sp.]